MAKVTMWAAVKGLQEHTAEQQKYFKLLQVCEVNKRLRQKMSIEEEDAPSLNHVNWRDLEALLGRMRQAFTNADASQANYWQNTILIVSRRLFGDPNTMLQEKNIRLQALPYWNPTHHKLNIHSLGIPKTIKIKDTNTGRQEIVDFEEFIEPGATVHIPYTYTVGGKHSSLYGVCPQLKPLPLMQDEEYGMDLEPTTYAEWCTYIDPTYTSLCCHRPAGWDTHRQRLVCSKCGTRKSDGVL